MATITVTMAMLGFAGWQQAQFYGQSYPVALSISPLRDEESRETAAISGPLPQPPNDFQRPANVSLTPAGMAAIFAEEMAEWAPGETFSWAEIQVQYRRTARHYGWRLEIADRILSKALKGVGCIRGQLDLRSQGKGRPITITFPLHQDIGP